MEQNPQLKNKNEGFFQKNQNYIIAGIIVVLLIIYFATQKPAPDNTAENNQESTEQTENSDTSSNEPSENGETSSTTTDTTKTDEPKSESSATTTATTPATGDGNVAASGTLMVSDAPTKGNLMVDSKAGKVYVQTKRDFASWVGKQITLQAEGSLKDFKFIGFKEASAASSPVATTPPVGNQPDVGGLPASEGGVSFTGTLQKSENADKGNYVVQAEKYGNVYVKTGKNLDSWVGKAVNGSASGTISSFTGLVVTEKK